MRRIKCFMVERTGLTRYSYRRFSISDQRTCSGRFGYHNAHMPIGDLLAEEPPEQPGNDSKAWPTKCEYCDYVFQDADRRQVFARQLWHDPLDPAKGTFEIREAPAGAMWFVDWFGSHRKGPDGKILSVMTPGGEWIVDSRASNCSLPDDKEHYCWVRHGTPPVVTVDKKGRTCSAGAGSIICGSYHGFLRNGYLED